MSEVVDVGGDGQGSPEDLSFEYSIADRRFRQAVEAAVRSAPILGDVSSGKPVIALGHYSQSQDRITAFKRKAGRKAWTRNLSQKATVIGQMTGLYGVVFHALYVIRVVDDGTMQNHTSSHMDEWAINRALTDGEFAVLGLDAIEESDGLRYVVRT